MTRKDRVALWGRMGLILLSLALMGGIVAEPLLRPLWPPQLTLPSGRDKHQCETRRVVDGFDGRRCDADAACRLVGDRPCAGVRDAGRDRRRRRSRIGLVIVSWLLSTRAQPRLPVL